MTTASACAGRVEDIRGVESYIKKVELDGVRRFKKDELLSYLHIGESSVLAWRPKYPHNDALLPVDRERIIELYHAHGYYDVEVISMVPLTKMGRVRLLGKKKGERRPGKTKITITVREGLPTPITAVAMQWPDGHPKGPAKGPVDPKATPEAIAAANELDVGDPFEIPGLTRSRGRLQAQLEDRGYAFAKVEETALVDPGRGAEVAFTLRPGPFVRIGEIKIEGLVGVPERYVRNEIDFVAGRRYSPALRARIEQAVYAMNVFQSVSVVTSDQESRPGEVDLTIRVVESKTQTIKVGPGIGIDPVRWEQRVTMLYSHKNLRQSMTRFDLRLTAGYAELPSLFRPVEHGPLIRIEPKFQKKGFLEKRTTWTLAPSFELGIWQGYQFYSPRLRMGPSRFFGRRVELSLTYNSRFVDFFNISPALRTTSTILGRDFRDPYFLSYLEPELTFYFVDSILRPRNGAILGMVYDIAGLGGHFSFHKLEPTLRGYYTPHERVTLAARASVGFIFPFGRRAGTPIDMKFYLGGADSVRGWGLRRLSPKAFDTGCIEGEPDCRGVPIGGQTMVMGNFEARVRVVDKLSMAAFFDAGDVREGIASFSPSNWNYSVGPGLRFDSPIGIFRLDAGFRLNTTDHSQYERIWALHLGLGETF